MILPALVLHCLVYYMSRRLGRAIAPLCAGACGPAGCCFLTIYSPQCRCICFECPLRTSWISAAVWRNKGVAVLFLKKKFIRMITLSIKLEGCVVPLLLLTFSERQFSWHHRVRFAATSQWLLSSWWCRQQTLLWCWSQKYRRGLRTQPPLCPPHKHTKHNSIEMKHLMSSLWVYL